MLADELKTGYPIPGAVAFEEYQGKGRARRGLLKKKVSGGVSE